MRMRMRIKLQMVAQKHPHHALHQASTPTCPQTCSAFAAPAVGPQPGSSALYRLFPHMPMLSHTMCLCVQVVCNGWVHICTRWGTLLLESQTWMAAPKPVLCVGILPNRLFHICIAGSSICSCQSHDPCDLQLGRPSFWVLNS